MSMATPHPEEGYRLAPQQRRIWSRRDRAGQVPTVCAVVAIAGPCEPSRLRAALEAQVARWEILRTGFLRHPDLRCPVQVVGAAGLDWRIREAAPGTLAEAVAEVMRRDRSASGLAGANEDGTGHALRATLITTGTGDACLVLVAPALCADPISLISLWRALGGQVAADSEHEPLQYADLAEWLNTMVDGDEGAGGRRYWERQDVAPGLSVRLAHVRPEVAVDARMDVGAASVPLDAATARAVVALAERRGVPLATVVLAAWRVVLARNTDWAPLVVGVAVDGRDIDELIGTIGPIQRSLPLAGEVARETSFLDLVAASARRLDEYVRWQHSFSWCRLAGVGEAPALPFAFAAYALPAARCLDDVTVSLVDLDDDAEAFDVRLTLLAHGDALRLRLDYDASRLSAAAMARLAEQVDTLLADAAARPETPVNALALVGPAERHLLLEELAPGVSSQPPVDTVHALIARAAAASPEATAVIAGTARLTYAELSARSNRLARWMRGAGVGRESIVAVLLERDVELVVSLLAILEAGGAYLPLDPTHPAERIGFVLADAAPALVVTTRAWAERLPAHGCPCLFLDDRTAEIDARSAAPLEPVSGGEDLAYVLYTSGSTGWPKGVLVPHRGVVNYLWWAAEYYGADDGQGAPVHSPVGFDLTVTSLFVPLVAGRAVTLLRDLDTVALLDELVAGAGYSLVKITPAHLDLLARSIAPERVAGWTRVLVIGGAALYGESLRFWRQHGPDIRLINEYGPTETVVGCCVHEVAAGDPLSGPMPIGRPIANARSFLVDEHLQPVPLGAVGEICIGGPGVARGYLGRSELTAECFVEAAFPAAGGRLYRTGDLGRYREDGVLEFLGRRDSQVEIRGHRIELGEIDAALLRHPAIAEAAATVVLTSSGEPSIVGHVRLAHAARLEDIRAALAAWLPPYMMPARIVTVDAMPINERGKIDRAALAKRDPGPVSVMAEHVSPRDPLELGLAQLWEDVLDLRPVSVTGDFFALGGHSLLAVQLLARIGKCFGRAIPLPALMAAPTVEHVAALLRDDRAVADAWHAPLVTMQANGTRLPFFCIHPTGGNVLCYASLARHLGDDQPFHAVQNPQLYAEESIAAAPALTIEGLAAVYVEAIRARQPHGPYVLGGWSSGGSIAVEMGRQLMGAGEEIGLVVLIDSGLPFYAVRPETEQPVALDDAHLSGSIARILSRMLGKQAEILPREQLASMDRSARLDYLYQVAQAVGFVPPGTPREHVIRLFHVFQAHTHAIRAHRPGPVDLPLTLVRSRDAQPDDMRDEALNAGLSDEEAFQWERLTMRPVQVYTVPGDHITMLRAPHVTHLAAIVRQQLDGVQATRAERRSMLDSPVGG